MFKTITEDDDRGQVGIGTLIVFIAMVLVAAIAAGVLINTAGFLQSKSQQTGQESSAQVSDRVQVISAYGNVNGNETVDKINLTVMRASGADDINLSRATVEWVGPDEAVTLVKASSPSASEFDVSAIKGTEPVLESREDRLQIQLDAAAIEGGDGLDEGVTVELKITTESGAITLHRLKVPESLTGKSVVQL